MAVVLREKEKPAVLAKVEVTVGADGSRRRPHPLPPTRVGQFEFVVEAEPQPGELHTENNRLTRTVEVRKEKIRVLLVQAYPSFEFRYLRNCSSATIRSPSTPSCRRPTWNTPSRTPRRCGSFPCGAKNCSPTTW